MEPVYDLMAHLLTEHFGVPAEEITPDSTFEQLDIDSLARVEMITLLEDHLQVTLRQEPEGTTLGEAAAYLERLVAESGAGPEAVAADRAEPTALAGPAR
ncbi:acyl carrier protein [Streptomyces olivoverticillatus]|uniref:Acyl carrier protein n=1 Tax=Streptomyces olivoverticillatus TaxID=66427 RepID=A0A7W7LPZ8_9ACTN|nr:phosphopantetheine-binding protein [Streptomyces olivoverticillatus]MBB4893591.1 acyl carrier protein [Streptomyces olivoverticillatus]